MDLRCRIRLGIRLWLVIVCGVAAATAGCQRRGTPRPKRDASGGETPVRPLPRPPMANLAAGRAYTLQPAPIDRYTDAGGRTLTDGKHASADDLDDGWVGFEQGRPTVTVDLEAVRSIGRVKVGFMSRPDAGIHPPKSVQVSVSLDGVRWPAGGKLATPDADASVFSLDMPGSPGRYVRVAIQRDTWSFIDEIQIFGAISSGASHPQPVRKVLLVTDVAGEYDEGRVRMTNLLQGMGLPFDVIQHDSLARSELSRYQLIVFAATSSRALMIDQATEQKIVDAVAHGANVLWVGRGIWGTFGTTGLPDAFGLRYIEQGWSSDMGIAHARFTNLAGDPDRLTVRKEMVYKVQAVQAAVEGRYLDKQGREVEIPFITRYSPREGGVAVYVSMPLLDLWKAAEAHDTYARAEVLFKYIRRLTSEGTVGRHPALEGKDAAVLLRLEDYVPGGEAMGHTTRLWLIRMERLLELTRQHHVPLNIALIPKYAHPFCNEYHDWGDHDPVIATLRRQAQRALDDGGSLIVHGYAHQNGSGPDDFSGDDWEMWDEDAKRFLPLSEQKKITDLAFAEVASKWRIKPTIWETPHYCGNADTFRAARASGFLYFTESDTKLFPNRHGYLNRAGGLLLNIPETAFNYPREPDAIKASGLVRQRSMLPRLVRLNGLFYLFYHNMSVHQERALENLLATAGQFDLWKPSLDEYAAFWVRRERVKLSSQIDPIQKRLVAEVTGAFRGLTLSVRLPDGAAPGEVTVDRSAVEAKSRQLDGAWYVYPVLPDARQCRVVIGYQAAPPGLSN